MYTPAHFAEDRPEEIAGIIRDFPLATLVAPTADGLVANHVPLLAEGEGLLVGHIARANDLHRAVAEGAGILAVFRADDSYVSPNWYPSKPAHHRHVPTWNYQAVHVTGRVSFPEDRKFLRGVVGRLTARFERERFGDAAWRMADAPADYMEAMLDAIVGLRIEIDRILAKSKLSQNRNSGDFENVAQVLRGEGRERMAEAMDRVHPRRKQG